MTEDIHEPEIMDRLKPRLMAHTLGDRDNTCLYCGAIHFAGAHACCQNGQIFIPPFKRMPDPLPTLLYDINDSRRRHFLDNILRYNTLFSFASIQFNHIAAAPFGLPVMKAQGSIRHFSSAVTPNDPNILAFGNFYVYEGQKAVDLRMDTPIAAASLNVDDGLDENIMKDFELCLRAHPFARFYKKMGELIKEEKKAGRNPDMMRMRVVDPYEYEKQQQQLQGHHGIYATEHSDDYVSVYYSSNVEQYVLPRGLVIYPKLKYNVPRPIFYWCKEVNCLCYPLLFPNGDPGYFWKGYIRYEPMSFEEKLQQYIDLMNENGEDIESTWDSDPEGRSSMTSAKKMRATHESDPNLESDYYSSDDESMNEYYDDDFSETMVLEQDDRHSNRVTKKEHLGEHYPRRKAIDVNNITTKEDDYDSGPDEDRIGEDNIELSATERLITVDDPFGDDAHSQADTSAELLNKDTNVDNDGQSTATIDLEEQNEEKIQIKPCITSENSPRVPLSAKKKIYVSLREWALFVSQERRRFRNRICESGKLGQVFIIDQVTRIQQQRLAEEKHNTQYMTSTKKKLLEAFQRTATRHNRTVGCLTSVPVSMPGSPRYLQKKYEDAVAMSNKLGKPDFFLTMTCSTFWPEIQSHLKKDQTWADNPFLMNEVFHKKKNALLDDVLGKPIKKGSRLRNPGLFGLVRWYTYSIEFQERGPPHMHLIISLVEHIKTVQQVDAICSAELPVVPDKHHPDYETQLKLRQLVEKYMVHTPCEDNVEAYCRAGLPNTCKKCRKNFPKPFSNKTEMGDRDYPALRRPDNGEKVTKAVRTLVGNKTTNQPGVSDPFFYSKNQPKKKDKAVTKIVKATNQHVVSYNPYLLSKYQCHMNIEAISSLKVIKYIFKYLFKGYDRALVECFENVGTDGGSSYGVSGEMTMQGHIMMPKNLKLPPGVIKKRKQDAIDQLKKNHIQPTDANGQKVVVYNECRFIEDMRAMTSAEAAWELMGYPRCGSSHTVTTLFIHKPDEEPIRMEIDEEEKALHDLENEDVKSKLKAYFDLCSSTGPSAEIAQDMTFEDLPKRFVYNRGVWQLRKNDYSTFKVGKIKFVRPKFLEQFAIRLLCIHKKGVKSFEDLKTVNGRVYETFIEAARALRLMNGEIEWDMCLTEAATLKNPTVLRRLFVSILLNCAPENPPQLWEDHKDDFFENKNWSTSKKKHTLFFTSVPHSKITDSNYQISFCQSLTEEQKNVVNEVVDSIENERNQPFFIEGQGGCGKTLIYETLFYRLQAKGYKVLCVAHTGVAASLLPQGSTAHRAFNIPIETAEKMHCRIEMESREAQQLRETSVVLWDEATMTDRRIVQAVNELFSFLHPEQRDLYHTLWCHQ